MQILLYIYLYIYIYLSKDITARVEHLLNSFALSFDVIQNRTEHRNNLESQRLNIHGYALFLYTYIYIYIYIIKDIEAKVEHLPNSFALLFYLLPPCLSSALIIIA